MSTNYLIQLLELVLKRNVAEFNGKIYHQTWGTSMGAKCSPSYADIFMADLEERFLESLDTEVRSNIILYKRYLDDIFLLYKGSEDSFILFMDSLNKFHHCIKFEAEHNFAEKKVHFLDVLVQIREDCIVTDLYVKPTSVNQYLLPNSCHPTHIHHNIPYSLGFRLRRICSQEDDFRRRLEELRGLLLDRNYRPRVIDAAFKKDDSFTSRSLHIVFSSARAPTRFVTSISSLYPK